MNQLNKQYQMVINFWKRQKINQPEDWIIKKANKKIKLYKRKLEELKCNN